VGKDSVRFQCHHCNHCCTEVVCLPTPWDVVRIVRETGANPLRFLEFLTPGDIEGVYKNDPTWLDVNGEKYLMALRRGPRGCHFLDKRTKKCTIYEARPILCRLYPFKLHETRDGAFKGFSLHSDVGCPRFRDGTVETAPLYALYLDDRDHQDAYATLVGAFNTKRYPGKAPAHFLRMFLDVKDGAHQLPPEFRANPCESSKK